MSRLYWNLRTGLAGGFFLAADNCAYFISIFETARGTRCQIMDHTFSPVSNTMKIESAKRKIKKMVTTEQDND